MNFPGMAHFGVYQVIASDCPWEHDNFGQAKHGAAKSKYSEMPLASIEAMPVGALADPLGALLFLWATGCQIADGAHTRVAAAWGFRLVTRAFSWVKVADACEGCHHLWDEHAAPPVASLDSPGRCARTRCGCLGFVVRAYRGPGSYTMQGVEDVFLGVNVEDVWLGVKGGGWSDGRAFRDAPEIIFEPVREHSRKPERVQDRIERLWPSAGPRLELFARRRRPNWDAWGHEAPNCDMVFGAEIGSTWPVPASAENARTELVTPTLFGDEGVTRG